jgi:hypothetical protein
VLGCGGGFNFLRQVERHFTDRKHYGVGDHGARIYQRGNLGGKRYKDI